MAPRWLRNDPEGRQASKHPLSRSQSGGLSTRPSDPAWRWVLILGLRDLRGNASRLGNLADTESPPGSGWSEDTYVYGPLVHGLTAAAVNECAQHCEDLFAVLRFLREPLEFSKRMLDYKAGTVTQFGEQLGGLDDAAIQRLSWCHLPQ